MKMVKENIEKYIESGIPIIYLKGLEFSNVYKIISIAANNLNIDDIEEYNGVMQEVKIKENTIRKDSNLESFLFERIEKGKTKKIITLLKDCDKQIFDSTVYGLIKNSAEKHIQNREYFNVIVIMSGKISVPTELLTYINFIEIPAPDENDRKKIIEEFKKEKNILIDEKNMRRLIFELRGMEKFQILKLLNMIHVNGFKSQEEIINEERENMINQSEVLELINEKEDLSKIGGVEVIKEWVRKKGKIFNDVKKAKEFGVDIPKGIMISGIHGCGKSIIVKGTGNVFNLSVIRLDLVKFIGGESWNSELKLVEALKTVERVSPCILWIDDIENIFRGLWISLKEEEIIIRVFSRLLSWLKERKENIFTIATVNDLEILPVEFIKRGSFDELFFIDLPDEKERKEIFEMLLKKKQKYHDRIGINEIVQNSEGMSATELDKVINSAVETVYLKGNEEISTRDILEALKRSTNYLKQNFEKVEKIREISKRINSIRANGVEQGDINYSEKFVIVENGVVITENVKIENKNDFYISKYQVTQKEFTDLMGFNPSYFKGEKLPVEQITWYDAVEFCNKKSIKEGFTPYYEINSINKEFHNIIKADIKISGGNGYRLPTTEEWEYAARGGIKSKGFKYSGSNNIDEVAWYYGDAGSISHEVGLKLSNELGIYDMSGNVWEWTDSGYGTNRIFRGGSWYDSFSHCEINTWNDSEPGFWFIYVGFRLARNK